MSVTKQTINKNLEFLYPTYNTRTLYKFLEKEIMAYKKKRPDYLKQRDKDVSKYWYLKTDHIMYVLYADLFVDSENQGEILKKLPDKFDYLQKFGVNNIHILPILKNSGDGGFAVDDYRKIEPGIGNMNDFEEMIKIAHKKGIQITFDLVLNHTSNNHMWAKELLAGDKKYRNYYIMDASHTGRSWMNIPEVFPDFAPGHWDYVPEIDEYFWSTFYSRYPASQNPYDENSIDEIDKSKLKKFNDFSQWDLNYRNPKVLLGMISNMLYLANKGVDMFRFDASTFLWKREDTSCFSLPEVYKLMDIFRFALEYVAPKTTILSEVNVSFNQILPYFKVGKSIHAAYNFLLMASMWEAVVSENTNFLYKTIECIPDIPESCTWVTFDVNHDELTLERLEESFPGIEGQKATKYLFKELTKEGAGVPFRFDKNTQEYGYGVSGTKWSLLGGENAKTKEEEELVYKKFFLLDAFKLSIGGVPLFYQGEELGVVNDYAYLEDEKKKDDNRFLKRVPITDKMREKVKKKNTRESKIFNQLKDLIKIRKKYQVFAQNGVDIIENKNNEMLVLKKKDEYGKVLLIFNFSSKRHKFKLKHAYLDLVKKRKVKETIELGKHEFCWLYSKY